MTAIDLTNPYLAGLVVVAAVDVATAAYAVARRDQPGARAVALIQVGGAVWALSYLQRLATTDPSTATVALALELLAAGLMASGVLVFGLEYTGRRVLVTLPRRATGAALIGSLLAAGLTNPVHGLLWTLPSPTVRAGLAIWTPRYEPAAALVAIGVLGAAVAGLGLVVQLARQTGGLYRRQLVPFAVALAIPLAFDAAYALGLSPVDGLVPTPYATGLSAVAFAVGALEFDLFDRSPVAPSRAHDVAVESLASPVLVVDGEGTLAHHNPAAGALLPADDPAVGDPLADHFPTLAGRLVDADGPFEAELVETARGRRRHVAVAATPMDSGWVVSLLDVTDRVLREQRMAVLYRLLRHNVRNETSVVIGHGQRVADSDDEALAAAGEAIVGAGRTLAAVSEEAGRMNSLLETDADPGVVDVADGVRAVVQAARRDHPDATVEADLPAAAMARCHVSVRDAVAELVENAVEHHDGDPHVAVRVTDGDDWVTVTVSDDGPGIPEAELSAIREGEERPLAHASGLGLWLVSWTTTASGGRLAFEENDPRGTVVVLELPAA